MGDDGCRPADRHAERRWACTNNVSMVDQCHQQGNCPSGFFTQSRRLADREEIEMTPQEFMDMFEVKLNVLEENKRIAEQKRRNVQAMLDASNKESM